MDEPPEKKLRISAFAVHAARGVIRDQKMRRNTMFILLLLALILLFSGSTFLQTMLNPREHPFGFILFWFACVWLTFTAFLLAIFDILLVRAQRRKVERILRAGLVPDPDSSATPEE
jgi:hypothetical protein